MMRKMMLTRRANAIMEATAIPAVEMPEPEEGVEVEGVDVACD